MRSKFNQNTTDAMNSNEHNFFYQTAKSQHTRWLFDCMALTCVQSACLRTILLNATRQTIANVARRQKKRTGVMNGACVERCTQNDGWITILRAKNMS